MKILYLDQNKWIDLARAAYGRASSPDLGEVLDFLRQAKEMKQVCLPISIAHYMETLNRKEESSRARLGEFMWDLSGGVSMARGPAILQYEIDEALWRRFPESVNPAKLTPLRLLGHGLSHARGEPVARFVVPPDWASFLSARDSYAFECWANEMIERSLLGAGPIPSLTTRMLQLYPPNLGEVEGHFASNLVTVRTWLAKLPQESLDDGVYLMSFTDILQALGDSLQRLGVAASAMASLGWHGIREFIDDLPTQRVATHLLRERARNQALLAEGNDLYDWMSLVPAAAYCDVVVAENLFTDLVNRGTLRKQAIVTAKLRDVPLLLTSVSRC